MKYFETFAGVGGFHLGIHKAFPNAECVGVSEIDKYSSIVLDKRLKGVRNYGDVCKIDWAEVPDFDMLVGGFPCQPVSVAGKRLGFDDPRWEATVQMFRAIDEKKPAIICLENVKGLLSHLKGETMKQITDRLEELGYHLKWQVLNALDYGVPQNRERVIIMGFRDPEACERFRFPEKQERVTKLKDVLQPESEVDPKYYLKAEAVVKLLNKMSDAQIRRLVSLGTWSQPTKFLDRNQKNYPDYAMTVDTVGTNGVGKVVNPITLKDQDHARTVRSGGASSLSDKHNHDIVGVVQVGVAKSYDVLKEREVAMTLDASMAKGFDNRGGRTGVAVVGSALRNRGEGKGIETRKDDAANAITSVGSDSMVSEIKTLNNGASQHDRIYDREGVAPTLAGSLGYSSQKHPFVVAQAENGKPYVVIPANTKKGYALAGAGDSVNLAVPTSKTRRGRVGKEVAQTLDTSCEQHVVVGEVTLAIRRLTPTETCRLMSWPDDWTDVEYDAPTKANPDKKKRMSDSQRYRQSGNGIVSNVVEAVMEELRRATRTTP